MILETKKGSMVAKVGEEIWEMTLIYSNGEKRTFETVYMKKGIIKDKFEIEQEGTIFYIYKEVEEKMYASFLSILKLLSEMVDLEKN